MPAPNRPRLIRKIYPAYVLAVTLATMAAGVYAWHTIRAATIDQADRDLEHKTRLVQAILQEHWDQDNAPPATTQPADPQATTAPARTALAQRCATLGQTAGTRVTLIVPDGRVLVDTEHDPATMDNHATRPEFQQALSGQIGRNERRSYTVETPMFYVAAPLNVGGQLVGAVRLSVPVKVIDGSLVGTRDRIAYVGIAAVLIMAAVGLAALNKIARPLQDIRRGAQRLAAGDFSHNLPATDSDEIGGLADALNLMARQLDEKIRTISQQNLQQQAVLASMVEGVMAVDPKERVIALNRAAADLLRVNISEARGRAIQEVVRNTQLQSFITRTLASSEPIEDDVMLTDEPEPRFLQASGTPLRNPADSAGGGKLGALVVLNDVTRMRRLENVRREFVANVSHELKTPVTAIKGFVETLRETATSDPASIEQFLPIIARQADRLHQIIEDLLMLSRIEQENESQQVKLALSPLREVLSAAIDDCRAKAEAAGVRLDLECPETASTWINGQLLEQAVVNLLDNAIKYSEGKSVRVDTLVGEHEIGVSVIDQGVGIPAEHLPHLFQRFYRVDKGRSRKLGGTGLGLAIVKHIAQAHHGRVSVESKLGQGSTFTIHLPVG